MRSRIAPLALTLAVLAAPAGGGGSVGAAPRDAPRNAPRNDRDTPPRELLVPFDELNVLLEQDAHRVLMTRAAYETLMLQAQERPSERAPIGAAIIAAEYEATLETERATIAGALTIDVLEDGLHAVPIPLALVGVRAAVLDDAAAPIGAGDDGRPVVFVTGVGRHRLELDLVTPLATDSARQTLTIQVPTPSATRFSLVAPGDIEVESVTGGAVASRVVTPGPTTRIELLKTERYTPLSVAMTLNSRLKRSQRSVATRSVMVSELTEAYEKLHAVISIDVLHRPVDQFRFEVPDGFELTDVTSPALAAWTLDETGPQPVLEVRLREPTTGRVVLRVSAARRAASPGAWRMPIVRPLDVVSAVSVVGLLVEDRLKVGSIDVDGLIPIDATVLTRAVPTAALGAPGDRSATLVRPIAAYYAPQASFDLRATLEKPPAALLTMTSLLVTLEETGHEVRGGITLLPQEDKLFDFAFAVEPGWHVTSVTGADTAPLPFERLGDDRSRVRVHLPKGIAPGAEARVYFHAHRTPAGWLDDWDTREIALPAFPVEDAATDRGAVAVATADDLAVRPITLDGLTPLDEGEKRKFGIGGVATELAYRYEQPSYRGTIAASRIKPRITARTFSFLRVEPDARFARYEIIYDVQRARTRELSLLLPPDTPQALSIVGLDGVALKGFAAEPVKIGGRAMRRWTATLTDARRGPVRLAVDFQQRTDHRDDAEEDLPLVTADQVAYQSGLVAIEGSAELDVEIVRHPRKVDIGELVDAEYEPGRRLLGAYGFVGNPPPVAIKVARPPAYAPAPAIVECAHLATAVSATGVSQTFARFDLRTQSLFLEIRLPDGATLWGATLDGRPTKPQRDGERLLLDLPPAPAGTAAVRHLEVVYEAPIDPFGLLGRSTLPAPELRFHSGRVAAGAGAPVPVADAMWDLFLPPAYTTLASKGTMVPEKIEPPRLAVVEVGRWLFEVAGGMRGPLALPRTVTAASDSAAPSMEVQELAARSRLSADQAAPAPVHAAKPQAADPAPQVAAKNERAGKDLLGVRSLDIALDRSGPSMRFRSFGDAPSVDVTVANARRLEFVAASMGLIVLIVGLILGRSARKQTRFVLWVAVSATALAVITGHSVVTHAANAAFYAVAVLVPLVLAMRGRRRLVKRLRAARMPTLTPSAVSGAVTGAILIASLVAIDQPAHGEADHGPPIVVPDDVILVPYVAESEKGDPLVPPLAAAGSDQLLLPYGLFIDLWNRAHPDRMFATVEPPAAYALAGGAFAGELPAEYELAAMNGERGERGESAESFVHLAGHLELDVFVDEPVVVPLALGGGVLTKAQLDGKPARLTMPRTGARRSIQPADASQTAMLLHVLGRGRHRLELAVRVPLERRGGWRIARGILPVAPGTALTITVPDAGTDVRLGAIHDRRAYETTRDDEAIRTAAPSDGTLAIEWRPKVSQGAVDLSLRAESSVVLDVREDGLRAVWNVQLAFPRGERETFSLTAPDGFLVERVEGPNVRGWEVAPAGAERNLIDVSLLQPARNVERLRVRLRRDEAIPASLTGDEPYRFAAPVFEVGGAALQSGTMLVRRSPMLHVRTVQTAGVTRMDVSEFAGTDTAQAHDESPMGTRPYEAYRFMTTPFTVAFEADPVATRASARLETILRIAERQRRVETRVILDVQDRPIYAVRLIVPASLDVKTVADPRTGVEAEWSLGAPAGDDRILSVFLPVGRSGRVPLVVRGELGPAGPLDSVPLPRFEVLGVPRQLGDIVVQVDPAFDAAPKDLVGCQTAFLKSVDRWLQPAQRGPARLVIHHDAATYSGRIALSVRRPEVSCYTVTNVRVTDRAIEDTVLIDFTVRQAGVRSVAFLVPEDLATAVISVPHLRSRTTVPAADRPGWVRMRIELEDEIMEHVRVLIEHDRLLTGDIHRAPIPIVETGRTDRRYVALENTGRDEAVVETHEGLEPLGRQQKEWQQIAPLVQGGSTTAFIVASGATEPALTFKTTQRQIVQTAGARIGLAETKLACDANGAYRAQQIYHVDNNTEQYLEIEVPAGAELWTTRVAGEPVKPTRVPGNPDRVRIPLVKTAPGDLDYPVMIKYGGTLDPLGRVASVAFPLIRAININVELSQARVFLPETHSWFDFGGSMRRVTKAGEFEAGYMSYQTTRVERLAETLREGNVYAQLRGASNYENLKSEITQLNRQLAGLGGNNELRDEQRMNTGALEQVDRQLAGIMLEDEAEEQLDNRVRLKSYWKDQRGGRARNVVQDLAGNFPDESVSTELQTRGDGVEGRFNDGWVSFSRATEPPASGPLESREGDTEASDDSAPDMNRPAGQEPARPSVRKDGRRGGRRGARAPQAPEVAQRQVIDELRKERDAEKKVGEDAKVLYGGDAGGKARRYQQRLMEKSGTFRAVGGGGAFASRPEEESVENIGRIDTDGLPQQSWQAIAAGETIAAGLVSVDVELPMRGREYRFTTPRGEVEITARAASTQSLMTLRRLGILALALAIILIIHRLAGRLAERMNRRTASTIMILAGACAALLGVLPLAGVAIVVIGVGMKVAARLEREPNMSAGA